MELARTLRILWQRRRLVAVGVLVAALAALLSVYQVSLTPPSLTSRTNEFATGSSEILVDTPASAFADLSKDLTQLDARATVFARFMATPTVLTLIARKAELPYDAIEAQGPYDLNLPVINQEPTAEKRSSQIIGEGALYRLRFENNPQLPLISVFTQAPSEQEALALARAAPAALGAYIDRIQAEQDTPEHLRVEIRALGRARGGVVNEGASLQIGTLVFLAVLAGWCMLMVPAHTIAQGWRRAGAGTNRGSNGALVANGNGQRRDEGASGAHQERNPVR